MQRTQLLLHQPAIKLGVVIMWMVFKAMKLIGDCQKDCGKWGNKDQDWGNKEEPE